MSIVEILKLIDKIKMEFKARQELGDSIPHVEQSCSLRIGPHSSSRLYHAFPLFSKIK